MKDTSQLKYANLLWAASHDRLANYQVAAAAEMSESQFSRCLNGRSEFSREEKIKLANYFGYPEAWLFQTVQPPARLQRSEVNGLVTA
jgi:hypothetical protein